MCDCYNRRDVLKGAGAVGMAGVGGAALSGSAVAHEHGNSFGYYSDQGKHDIPDSGEEETVRVNVYTHQSFRNYVGVDSDEWNHWSDRVDMCLEILEDFFGDHFMSEEDGLDRYGRFSTYNGMGDSIHCPDSSDWEADGSIDDDDLMETRPSHMRRQWRFTLYLVANGDGRLGRSRRNPATGDPSRNEDRYHGSAGYVNAILRDSWPSLDTPDNYIDAMILHEIFHAFTDLPGCGDNADYHDHELGDPQTYTVWTSPYTYADPTVMASGYTAGASAAQDHCLPEKDCEGDDWRQTSLEVMPHPSLEITDCTYNALRWFFLKSRYITGDHGRDWNSYRDDYGF